VVNITRAAQMSPGNT